MRVELASICCYTWVSEMGKLSDCEKRLGVRFRQGSLLEQALVHSSYVNEKPDCDAQSNERLEFLGDAVLNLVITETLYEEFPGLSEGQLTEIRAYLVCRSTLAELASSLGLGEWLLLGRGEEMSGGRTRPSNLANAMEALIGALYLDQGLAKARKFVLKQFRSELERIRAGKVAPNYKALVQELVQGQGRVGPVYRLVEIRGPDHCKEFTAEILVDGQALGRGVGRSKKDAESEAARAAWAKLRCSYG